MAISGASSAEASMASAAKARSGDVTGRSVRIGGAETGVSEKNRAAQGEMLTSTMSQATSIAQEAFKFNEDAKIKDQMNKGQMKNVVSQNDSVAKQALGVPSGDSPSSQMSGIGATALGIDQRALTDTQTA